MGKVTFRRFLQQRQHDNNPIGDIAIDALIDVQIGCFTGRLTPERLREHIDDEHSYNIAAGVFEALDRAERAWLDERSK